MLEVAPSFFLNFFLFLLIPFITGFLLKKINLPPIIGYILGGIIIGNLFSHTISGQVINSFAYFGILLLLFTTGLEVNFEKLLQLKKFIVIGGLIQIFLSILWVTFISALFGFTLAQSLLIGIAFMSSSTTLVAKIIQDRGEESSFLGELALGVLMFQDLAFIPAIIIFESFHSKNTDNLTILWQITKGIGISTVILLGMYYIGGKIIPIIFNKVAQTSRELLNLLIILFIFFVAFFSSSLGVPTLIGMFMAGVLVSQTLEHHHVFTQIRPLRDILAIIFFVFIGTHVNVSQIITLIPAIVLFSAAIIIVKALIILIIFLYFKFNSKIAFSLSIFLFQVSENAFILLSLAFANKVFTDKEYLMVITSALLTLIATPFIINQKDILYAYVRRVLKKYLPAAELFISNRLDFNRFPSEEIILKNHIVICGYGRVGSYIGRALTLANIDFIAIDYNFQTVEKAKKEGTKIIYGDPTDMEILEYAQVATAAVVISVIPDKNTQELIILNSKRLNPKIILFARIHKHEQHLRLKDLGAHVIVQPELEAALSIIHRLYYLNRMSPDDIARKIHHFKLEHGMT